MKCLLTCANREWTATSPLKPARFGAPFDSCCRRRNRLRSLGDSTTTRQERALLGGLGF